MPVLRLAPYSAESKSLEERYAARAGEAPATRAAKPRLLLAQHDASSVVVYQAYKAAIAEYAVAHGHFGGEHFSFARMSWVKPQFLWMMHRSSWASARDQERVLAVRLRRDFWDALLARAVDPPEKGADVVLQWDPMHAPFAGTPLWYRVAQVGLRGDALAALRGPGVVAVDDVTPLAHRVAADRAAWRARAPPPAAPPPFDFDTPVEPQYAVRDEVRRRLGVFVL